MGAIEHLTIAITAEAAERVRARVESGDYSDASAVVAEALAVLDAREQVLPAPGESSPHRTAEQVLSRLDAGRDRHGLQR